MQWLIDIILVLCKAYTDQAILDAKVIPSGTIILWKDLFATIPDGWVICNGANGTPDLRGLFIRGGGGVDPIHTTGGTTTHTHTGDNSHTHPIPPGSFIQSGTGYHNVTDSPKKGGDTGGSGTLPPYHVLWYIMKL